MTHIMLDAGHGQRDPGAIGPTGLQEKDAALALVKRLGRLLGEQGLEVSYTRSDDWRLVDESSAEDLRARADKANQARADYFVSVHHNSATLAKANGLETYVLARGTQAEALAQKVQTHLVSATGLADRGVKTADLAVLRETDMPAILVEVGFVSNPQEEQLLLEAAFLDKAALAVAQGIVEHLNQAWQEEAGGQTIPLRRWPQ